MSAPLIVSLGTTPEQAGRLRALQEAFAAVCNELAPVVQSTRCWNRVALHHMTYRGLRDKFPGLGSQMICNAIYSVSRTSRVLYQAPGSPFNIVRLGSRPLPLIHFLPSAPVYFDRHTLSIKSGQLSMFTLDGRMKFEINVTPADELRFHAEKLNEIVLTSHAGAFQLRFGFGALQLATDNGPQNTTLAAEIADAAHAPDYVMVMPQASVPLSGVSP